MVRRRSRFRGRTVPWAVRQGGVRALPISTVRWIAGPGAASASLAAGFPSGESPSKYRGPLRERSPAQRGPELSVAAQTVESKRLANGAWILVLPTAVPAPGYRGVASVQLWIAAGAGAERKSEHGCAHLFEHMVFKPRVHADGRERDLASVVEGRGGDVNAFTSHDETVFHATVPADGFDEVATMLIESVIGGEFDAELLAREQDVVVEEIRQYADDPASRSVQLMMADLYAGHAYARPVLGEEAEVRALSPAKLRAWGRRMFRGDRIVFVAAGPVEAAHVEALVAPLLEGLPPGPARTRAAPRPQPLSAPAFRVVREDVQEAYLRLAWMGGEGLDADALALDVAAVCLGQGESSRLANGVRRRARLVSDAYASYLGGQESGTFMISAQAEVETVEAASEALLREVESLARLPIEAEELSRARALLQSSLVYRRETVQGQAHALGYFARMSGDLEAEAGYFERLAALTAEDVRLACARCLSPASVALTLIVPREQIDARHARALQRRLERRGSSGRSGKRASSKGTPRRGGLGIWEAAHASGLRIVARPDPSIPVVAGWLVWPGGQRIEASRHAGSSSLSASLLNRGTTRREGDALAREIEGLAAVLDGFSGHNSVGVQMESLAVHSSTVLARMLECALVPRFDAEELDEARRVTLADLEADRDDVGHLAYREMLRTLYRGHPHGRDLRGTPAALARINSAMLARNWARDYPLGRGVLALAGAFDLDVVLAEIDEVVEQLGGAPQDPGRGRERAGLEAPRWPRRPIERELVRERAQGQCVIGFPGLALGDPSVASLDVLCSVLGGQSGRLFESLREREGLVYQVGASSSEHVNSGHVVFYAAASQDKLDATRAAIEAEIALIRSVAASPAELDRAKRWLIGQFESGMQRRGRVASRMVFGAAYGLGPEHYLRYPERVARVKNRDVLALAERLLDPRRQVTVLARGEAS